MRNVFAAVALATLSSAASAQSMNAQTFHKRATALQKKGPLALFSQGEIKTLMKEGQAAGLRAREQRLAAVKSGGKPRYCPPEDQTRMASTEFMKRLGAIPPAERQKIDMTEATLRLLAVKFPCKG